MLVLIAKSLLALALGGLFTFTTVLGERNNFRVQRGWYIIVTAFGLLWLGSLIDLADGLIPALSTEFYQNIIGKWLGQGGGLITLFVGLLLWAPKITGFRDSYLLKIKTSEERFRMLAEKATDMLAEHDMEGRFLYTTPGSKHIVGYEPEELVNKSIYEFIDPDQLEMVQHEHRKIMEQKDPVTSTYKFKHKDGHFIWLETVTRLYEGSGEEKQQRILAMSRDVSERIRYENELMVLNESLKLQQKRFRMLYTLAVSKHLDLDGKLDLTLALSAETLNMGLGIISRIEGDEYKILYFTPATASLEKGQIFELGKTYCSITIQEEGVVAIDQMSASKHAGHPCHEAMALESYIGVPIYVKGEVYGTLNFSQPEVRETNFTEGDKDFIRLVSQWVSRVLEQEQANLMLQQSEERYKSIVSSSVVGVILIDMDGTIQAFNSAAERIFGYTERAIKGKNVRILMYNSEHAKDNESFKDYLQTELPQFIGTSREVAAVTRKGEKIHIELGISVVQTEDQHFFSGSVMDITARKKAELDLANAHLQLKSVFNSATQVAIIATDLEGKVTIFNPGAEHMLGYTSKEVIGQSTAIFHVEAEVNKWAEELSNQLDRDIEGFETFVALAKLGGQSEHEWTYVRKDGSKLTVNSAVTALMDTSGSINGYLGIILDITSRKQAEEALKLAKTVAEEANQTKSDFLANMSHELRTPLNSVIGFSNILLSTAAKKLGEKDTTYLSRIHENGKHLLNLINDVLDLSKIEAGRMDLELVELDLGVQIKEVAGLLESQVQDKPVELITNIPENLSPNMVDPGKMKQVLMNLISNSLKFTEKGSITIDVVKSKKTQKVAAISVTDTGIGIPQDRLEKIFDEFAQVDSSTQRKYGGTGLGLSISRRMCQLMNCTLGVMSEEGRGSTFTITLPDQTGSIDEIDQPLRAVDETRGKDRPVIALQDNLTGYSILVVDDDPDSQTLIAHYLADTGCEIQNAGSVKEALAAMDETKPDLITLDLRMPDAGGEKLLEALQQDKALKNIPVIIISIIAQETRGAIDGVAEFIQKPIQRQQLLWAIKRHLKMTGKSILIIEDDPDMRETLSVYAKGPGIDVSSAENGTSALKYIYTSNPDLILLDLKMPGMNGEELLRILRSDPLLASIPVIIVTGKDLSSSEKVYFKSEGIDIISKGASLEIELKHHLKEFFPR